MTQPFTGSWSINLDKSRVWDTDNERWVSPDPIGREDLTLYTDDEIYDQTISVGLAPTYHMGYTARWNGDWVPYMCRRVETPPTTTGHAGHPRMELGPSHQFEENAPTAWIKMVKVSDTFHYRISKDVDGTSPGYVMSRRLESSGDSFQSTVLSPAGDVVIVRVFERVS
jgi:hypothetical protein